MILKVSEEQIANISNDLDSISAVAEYAQLVAQELVESTKKDVYINIRLRAFEGLFMLIKAHAETLYKSIDEFDREYE